MDYLASALITLFMACVQPADIEILFAGDAMMHTGQLEAAKRGAEGYDFSYCFTEIAPYVIDADYAVVNLETPVAKGSHSGYPQFNAPREYVEALTAAGFDLFLTANNHTLDRRDNGLKQTVALLDSLGLDHIGTYADPADRARHIPLVVNIRGVKVGFLNYTYGTNGFSVSSDAVVDYINADKIRADIAATRHAGAEILVVAMHWGEEYTLTPVAYEKRWAELLEREGVDIIMGGHPHVVQPMELRENRFTGRPLFLAYSHGNFISNMMTRDTRGGLMTRVTISRDPKDGRAYVSDAGYRLIFTVPPTNGSFRPSASSSMTPVGDRYHFARENYRIEYADSVDGFWRDHARSFATSARSIFRAQNKGPVKEL